jgi:hypothetical protein
LFGNMPFTDGFESGLSNWTAAKGTASRSTTRAHSGAYSYVTNEDMDVITHAFPSSQNGIVTVWFYDSALDLSVRSMVRADNAPWSESVQWRGMGIDTPTSWTRYVTRIGSTYAATTVNRTTGWHSLTWDYTSGTHVKMYIDGTLVA